jgi:hypothetical protein
VVKIPRFIKEEGDYYLGIDPARYGRSKAAFAVAKLKEKENIEIVHGEEIDKSSLIDLETRTNQLNNLFNFRKIFILYFLVDDNQRNSHFVYPYGLFRRTFIIGLENGLHSHSTRRKNFVLNTMSFLQNNGYVKTNYKNSRGFIKSNFSSWDNEGSLNGVDYKIQDSIHNHLRFGESIIHRKGSTELIVGQEAVIPLSMTRGSLIVKPKYDNVVLQTANYSCSHGAGRKLSRTDSLKHWGSGMKESERKIYKTCVPKRNDVFIPIFMSKFKHPSRISIIIFI